MAQPGNSGQLVNSVGRLVIDQYRNAYLVTSGIGNPVLYRIGTSEFMALLRRLIRERGENLTKWQLKEFVDELYAQAEHTGEKVTVARRVAQRANGDIVVALHDDRNTQVLIGPGKVEILASGSETLFYRSSSALAMVMPAAAGSGRLLAKYLNLHAVAFTLYLGWITYTLAHAKGRFDQLPDLGAGRRSRHR
ncbi:MAG: hypothetical protein IPH51_22720 [Rubrivivax sp.]|nr:hypothetical protein [Rubrivivax sp.]